ncbi:MAG: GAF domain-containing protein [Deltaproteobacteria bacterium]|nr:GAF domain-containing protein [Deltaproteobacteria bacterium]
MIDSTSRTNPNRGASAASARLLAPGLPRVAAAIAALVIVSVCGFNSVRSIGHPFPGFFVWENLFVPAVGSSSWPGVKSGLLYHSWLLSADGLALANAGDLSRVLADKKPGDVVVYEAEHAGVRYAVSVPVSVFGLREYVESTGIYLIDAVALMVLAVVILYLKPSGADANALFVFATALGLYLATSIDLFGPYLFRGAYFFFFGAAPTSALYVVSHFPVGRRRRRYEDALLLLALTASIAFGIASNLAFYGHRETLLRLDRLFHVYVASSIVAAVAFFAWHFHTASDHAVRQRTKVVLVSSLGAFLPAVALFAVYAGLVAIPLNLLTVFFVLFPVGIGYAIARHDLFDIDRLIKRALAYVMLSAAVLGTYGLTITLLEAMFENLTGTAERLTSGLVVLALLLLFNPSRERTQAFVDRLYDRRRYEYRDVVRAASRRFSSILDFESLARAALELIDETVQPVSAEIFTLDDGGRPIRRALLLDHAPGSTAARIEIADRPAPELNEVAALLREQDLLTGGMAQNDDDTGGDGGAAADANRRYDGAVLAREFATSMKLEGRLTGFVAVGSKRAGGYHTADDAELLRTMSNQLAIALENAQAYKTIGLLNQDLAAKARALVGANAELRQAQDQLVHSERLAAIGELAGAVAHAMRNPLAAIKMAAEFGGMEFENQPAAENFADIRSEATRLERRITDLLDFARPFEPNPERVDLRAVVARAVEISRSKAAQKNVRLQLENEGDEKLLADLDVSLFEQVVVELVANAIDASPENDCIVVATGRSAEDGVATLWASVRDNGPGIPLEKRARIYDLFFTTKKTGTGFGLATVKKIVDRHGGTIALQVGENGGTTFTVRVRGV